MNVFSFISPRNRANIEDDDETEGLENLNGAERPTPPDPLENPHVAHLNQPDHLQGNHEIPRPRNLTIETPDDSNGGTPRTPRTPAVEKMPRPIMGGIITNADESNHVWVGGKPNVRWTRLDSSIVQRTPPPGRHRYHKDAKYYEKRIAGSTVPFTAKSDLIQFTRSVFEFFKSHGMDTITYLPDPANPDKMESVVEKPNLFTKEYVLTQIPIYSAKYDSYDDLNEQSARLYLLKSLDAELERRVTQALITTESPGFLLTWMTFIEKIRILSVGRVTNIQKRVEERKPQAYAGQNLEAMAAANILDLVDLQQAGWFSLSTGNIMVRSFASANSECPEYRQFAYDLLTRYKEATKTCFHKNSHEATAYMESQGLGFEEVCNKFGDYYRAAHQDGLWLPSKNVRDTGAPTFANKATRSKIYVLAQNSGATPSAPSGTCHSCGKTGHWARNCPNKSKASPSGKPPNGIAKSWQRTPPTDGQSETKSVKGESFHWCAKCKRWSKSHGTATHRSKSDTTAPLSTPTAAVATETRTEVHLTPTYTAWHYSTSVSTPTLIQRAFATIAKPFLFSFLAMLATTLSVWCLPYVVALVNALQWGILAPMSWLLSFLVFLYLQPKFSEPPPSNPPAFANRYQRRNFGKLMERHLESRLRPGHRPSPTASQHGQSSRHRSGFRAPSSKSPIGKPVRQFNRQFPLRLRKRNRYPIRSPYVFRSILTRTALNDFSRKLPTAPPVNRKRTSPATTTNSKPLPFRGVTFARVTKWSDGPRTQHFGGKPEQHPSPKKSFVPPQRLPTSIGIQNYQFYDYTIANDEDRKVFNRMSIVSRRAAKTIQDGVKFKMHRPRSTLKQQYFLPEGFQAPTTSPIITCNVALHAPTNPTLRTKLLEYAPSWFRTMMAKVPNKHTVVWDSGASISVTPHRSDFTGPIEMFVQRPTLKGISDKLVSIHGKGNVSWSFEDTNGMLRTLVVPCLYVPEINQRLLSTTSLLESYPAESLHIQDRRLLLSGSSDQGCGPIEAYIDPENNLPTSDMFDLTYSYKFVDQFEAMTTVVSNDNYNLTEPEKELLRWHQRLAHIDFNKVKFLFRSGILARSESTRALQTAASKLRSHPRCAACQFGKQCRLSVPTTTQAKVSDSVGALSRESTRPGQLISVDHFVCKTKGRLFSSRGRTPTNEMYEGGCVFVDNFSGYVHIELQQHLNTDETLKAKHNYEAIAMDHGVVPHSYLSDQGSVFTSHEFAAKLKQFEQVTKFAGVGAHHQNGVAERSIRTVVSIARTMMMHAAIHWPSVSDTSLWPMAIMYAAYVYNRMPVIATGLCPLDSFSKQRWKQSQIHDMHVWGCPVYVLDKRLGDGKKIPKWSPRSNRYIYMGVSDKHSSTVPLVLNPMTHVISPQFNVVLDEWFATIGTGNKDERTDFNSEVWTKMFGDSRYQYMYDDNDDLDPDDLTNTPPNLEMTNLRNDRVEDAILTHIPPTPLPVADPPTAIAPESRDTNRFSPLAPLDSDDEAGDIVSPTWTNDVPLPEFSSPSPQQRESAPSPSVATPVATPMTPSLASTPPPIANSSPAPVPIAPTAPTNDTVVPSTSEPIFQPVGLRRSQRTRRAPSRMNLQATFDSSFLESSSCFNIERTPYGLHHENRGSFAYLLQALTTIEPPTAVSTLISTDIFKATVGDPDTFSYDEAMADTEHADEWRKAMLREIQALEKHGTWVLDDFDNAATKVLPGTWVFRRKRAPDGTILKYKARYCVRGDLQISTNETFAPVVHWSTIRLFLTLSMLLQWETTTIDFSQAFVQATLKDPVWIHLPRGFHSDSDSGTKQCLKLLKSLYGLAEAPRLWYLHLFSALINSLGFVQSAIDPCILLKPNMMIVVFVDDCAISFKYQHDYDDLISKLRALNFELTEEGPFTKFLGIQFTRSGSTIRMTQSGLIDQIAAATGLTSANPNHIPTTQEALGSDPDGVLMKETWSYRSIIGMLLYLSTNTRPDIAFAVSQAARYSNKPMQSHATAVKTIVRYLIGTRDQGTIVTPTGTLDIKLYVDADFAGLFRNENETDPNSARSRTGYILMLGGFPLIWKSHLQTEISLSTLEAEYSALSSATRALIPIRELLFEISDTIVLPSTLVTTITSTIFEDNQGAFLLGTTQRITARTRYFLVKFHHFWEYIKMENGNKRRMILEKVATEFQGADFLTKGQNRLIFQRNRKQVLGW